MSATQRPARAGGYLDPVEIKKVSESAADQPSRGTPMPLPHDHPRDVLRRWCEPTYAADLERWVHEAYDNGRMTPALALHLMALTAIDAGSEGIAEGGRIERGES